MRLSCLCEWGVVLVGPSWRRRRVLKVGWLKVERNPRRAQAPLLDPLLLFFFCLPSVPGPACEASRAMRLTDLSEAGIWRRRSLSTLCKDFKPVGGECARRRH